MRAVFGRWAYEEVQTPMIERFDVLERGLGAETTELLFQFNDRRSTALALRPEMTTPVARLVSTRMREAPLPLRLAYVAPVFRYYEQPQEGRMRELTQAGVELIGAAGIDADAETLFMAIEALAEIGLHDARFDINDARVVDGILDGVGLDGERARAAKEQIKRRNLVALRAFDARAGRVRASPRRSRRDRARARDLPHAGVARGAGRARGDAGARRVRWGTHSASPSTSRCCATSSTTRAFCSKATSRRSASRCAAADGTTRCCRASASTSPPSAGRRASSGCSSRSNVAASTCASAAIASTCSSPARTSSRRASAPRATSCATRARDLGDEALLDEARAHGIPRVVIASTARCGSCASARASARCRRRARRRTGTHGE